MCTLVYSTPYVFRGATLVWVSYMATFSVVLDSALCDRFGLTIFQRVTYVKFLNHILITFKRNAILCYYANRFGGVLLLAGNKSAIRPFE